MTDDLRLVELLTARLCHDLVGPVGAIVNGVELLGDAAGADPEVTTLIADSARRASRRLQVYRVAYGSASNLSGSRRLDEARRLIQSLCETQANIKLDWAAADDAAERAAGRTCIKITLILALIATEVLPRGGSARVRHTAQGGNRLYFQVTAEGPHARLPDEVFAAFAGGNEDTWSPKGAPIILALRLAKSVGGILTLSASAADRVDMRCDLPAGA